MQATQIVKKILSYLGYDDPEINEREIDSRVVVDIKVTNARDLIGEKGETLFVLQHVARRIAAKQISPALVLDIDINGYKKMRENVLRDFALDVAEQVRFHKKPIELDPMPSIDRRVIHLTLANFPDLLTESSGDGENRYVIIRPFP